MRVGLCCSVVALTVALLGASAEALPLYSFEGDLQGFFGTGGSTAELSTVGATDGVNSVKYSLITPATFEGLRTETVLPAALNDPPGVKSIVFDLTLEEAFAGGFASLGVTMFGASQPDYPGGQRFESVQFADFIPLEAFAAGTYLNQSISLSSGTHPLTGVSGSSFNDIFGGFGTGPDDMIPTGFQFFLNKSGTAPLAIYIDNIRTEVPEPTSLAMLAVAGVTLLAGARRYRKAG